MAHGPRSVPFDVRYHTLNGTTTDLTEYTFSAQSIGTAPADGERRFVIVGMGMGGGSSVTDQCEPADMRIDGKHAQLLGRCRYSTSSGGSGMSVWMAEVTDVSTTTDILAHAQDGTSYMVYCIHSIITGPEGIGIREVLELNQDTSAAKTLDVEGAKGGCIIGYSYGRSDPTHTWSGLTEDVDDAAYSTGALSAASDNISTDGNVSITATPSVAMSPGNYVVVSFAPGDSNKISNKSGIRAQIQISEQNVATSAAGDTYDTLSHGWLYVFVVDRGGTTSGEVVSGSYDLLTNDSGGSAPTFVFGWGSGFDHIEVWKVDCSGVSGGLTGIYNNDTVATWMGAIWFEDDPTILDEAGSIITGSATGGLTSASTSGTSVLPVYAVAFDAVANNVKDDESPFSRSIASSEAGTAFGGLYIDPLVDLSSETYTTTKLYRTTATASPVILMLFDDISMDANFD